MDIFASPQEGEASRQAVRGCRKTLTHLFDASVPRRRPRRRVAPPFLQLFRSIRRQDFFFFFLAVEFFDFHLASFRNLAAMYFTNKHMI